jgi:hypothetical protein
MKKYFFVFLFFALSGIVYCLLIRKSVSQRANPHFVSIRDNKFSLNGKMFYPVSVNYLVGFQSDKSGIWLCPSVDYRVDSKIQYQTKEEGLRHLKADMDLIREMGFNAIRLVGTDISVDKQTGIRSLSVRKTINVDTSFSLTQELNYDQYFNALEEAFGIIGRAGLKIVLLNSVFPENKGTEEHLRRLTSRFSTDSTLMAYDLFNEPLYFDSIPRSKEDVYKNVKAWKKIVADNAPDQLCTIGLEGVREVFEWDPNMLDVDFLSFHPYEYEPEQVRNEVYWYGKYVKTPWIIGETALPADNDSVSYDVQKEFARKTLKQVYDCGAIGYTWWQYKDVNWQLFHPSFLGIMNRKGEIKPVAEAFQKFDPTAKKDSCICLKNYYNYSMHKNFRLVGHLMDADNKPIEGGVILAWNQWWSHSYHTITKADGSFELLSDFPLYHWMASATLYTMVRGDILPDTANRKIGGIPTLDIGELKVDRLKFINR